MIKIGCIGKIIRGDEAGYQLSIIDDQENTGGYIISISKSFKQNSPESYDDWVPDYAALEAYFSESNWIVKWRNDS